MLDRLVAIGRMFIVVLFCLLAVGCGGKLSIGNYEKIKEGMTESEVQAILGIGEEQASSSINIPGQSISVPGGGNVSIKGMSSSAKVVKWESGGKVITITFSDGKVMAKAQFGL